MTYNVSSGTLNTTIPIPFRRQAENQQLKFKSNNSEIYNNPFSLDELTDAISKCHNTAAGPDDIHYPLPNAYQPKPAAGPDDIHYPLPNA